MNPRPKTFRTGVYMLVPMINFAIRGSIGREAGIASLLEFHLYRNRHSAQTILQVGALTASAGVTRQDGSRLGGYGVVIIVCDYI